MMYEHLSPMIASGAIVAPIAGAYSFDQYPQALAAAAKFGGKVILKPAQATS